MRGIIKVFEKIILRRVKKMENKLLCMLVKRINIAAMDPAVFEAIAGKFVLNEVEALIVKNEAVKKILLIKRPADDIYWPHLYHSPGTVLRSSDSPGKYKEAMERIGNEVGCRVRIIKLLDTGIYRTKRGTSHKIIFLCEASDANGNRILGKFFPVHSLPDNTIKHHRDIIKKYF